MCGRFSLGIDSDDLAFELGNQYFHAIARHNQQRQRDLDGDEEQPEDDHDNGQDDANGGEENTDSNQADGGLDELPRSASQRSRASQSSDVGDSIRWADQSDKENFRKRYNVAPQSRSVVVRFPKSTTKDVQTSVQPRIPQLELMKWGLVPSWTKRAPEKPLQTINCRDDTLFSGQGMWSPIRGSKRCVVVAQGFYEWLAKGKEKIPHFTKLKDDKLMVMAGLWDNVVYQGSTEVLKTFTIITTSSNKQLSFLHDRMPAILTTPQEIALWLSDEPWSPKVQALIRPFSGELECYKVPYEVGKIGKDSSDFIKPINERKGNIMSMFAAQAKSSPSKTASSSSPVQPPGSTSTSKPKPEKDLKPKSSEIKSRSKPLKEEAEGKKRDRSSSVEIIEDTEPPSQKKVKK
ncbi:DUF159-domain-containing protein [Meredithblackwellia eburnea MCA 4105]